MQRRRHRAPHHHHHHHSRDVANDAKTARDRRTVRAGSWALHSWALAPSYAKRWACELQPCIYVRAFSRPLLKSQVAGRRSLRSERSWVQQHKPVLRCIGARGLWFSYIAAFILQINWLICNITYMNTRITEIFCSIHCVPEYEFYPSLGIGKKQPLICKIITLACCDIIRHTIIWMHAKCCCCMLCAIVWCVIVFLCVSSLVQDHSLCLYCESDSLMNLRYNGYELCGLQSMWTKT